jgi:exopolysaccharide production protein ExoQ
MLPLLVFAAMGTFSFENGSANSALGAPFATIVSPLSADESQFLRLQTIGVYLVCCFAMVPPIRTLAFDFVRNKLIGGVLFLAVLSAFWSVNATSTLFHCALLAINMAFAFYLSRRFEPNDLMKLMLAVGICAAVGSILLICLFPQYGLQSRGGSIAGQWQGIFMQKNVCGFALTLLLLPIFYVRLSGRYSLLARALYSVLILIIVAETRSVGAWVVCLCCIGFSVALLILHRMRSKDRITIVALFTLVPIAVAWLASANWRDVLSAIGKDPTMTGRTMIWSVLLVSIAKHPFLGYGYMAFWQGLRGESANVALAMNWPGITYAENGIIELCLGLGLVGVTLFVLLYTRAMRDAFYCLRRRASSEAMWYTTILVYVAASNIESGRVFFPSDLGFILLIVACVRLRREAKALRLEASA